MRLKPRPMRSSARFAVWITLGYLIFASAWIFAGEPFVRSFVAQGAGSAEFQILEKILFILLTAAFLYGHSLNMLRLGRRSRIDSDPQAHTAPAMLSGATIAVTGAAILVLVVIAAVGLELHQNHDKTVEDARIESANLAGALNNEVQESVATVDHALRG